MQRVIGIDFGTTNSVMSVLEPDGRTHNATFGPELLATFRSVLCFWSDEDRGKRTLHSAAGPEAIEAYLDDPLDSRLIMSMKSYLAQRSFTQTTLFGRNVTLEQLIAIFLRAFLAASGVDVADALIVAGRPVRFVGETADDAFGVERLCAGFAAAGMDNVDVAFEPEAAGYRFAQSLDRPATVLIGDFGGGTSDFSIVRFEGGRVAPLATTGVGIAGDAFDFRIIDNVISPLLGKGDTYRPDAWGKGADLPVPPEYFTAFARWHRLSLMKAPKTMRDISDVAKTAQHPERLRGLLTLIEDEMGYQLYQIVSAAKAELSRHAETRLRFRHKNIEIDRVITRAEFDGWIAADVARMAETVDATLAQAGLSADGVDHIFLTGGTSFVPAVQAMFAQRFGAEKVSAGSEFVSVAEGLALIGRDRLRAV